MIANDIYQNLNKYFNPTDSSIILTSTFKLNLRGKAICDINEYTGKDGTRQTVRLGSYNYFEFNALVEGKDGKKRSINFLLSHSELFNFNTFCEDYHKKIVSSINNKISREELKKEMKTIWNPDNVNLSPIGFTISYNDEASGLGKKIIINMYVIKKESNDYISSLTLKDFIYFTNFNKELFNDYTILLSNAYTQALILERTGSENSQENSSNKKSSAKNVPSFDEDDGFGSSSTPTKEKKEEIKSSEKPLDDGFGIDDFEEEKPKEEKSVSKETKEFIESEKEPEINIEDNFEDEASNDFERQMEEESDELPDSFKSESEKSAGNSDDKFDDDFDNF